jgi:hypothetical protein
MFRVVLKQVLLRLFYSQGIHKQYPLTNGKHEEYSTVGNTIFILTKTGIGCILRLVPRGLRNSEPGRK